MQKMWAQFTAGCVARSGPLLQHVSTVEVARDLDIMRALVGDRSLNFFGASYGTFIGATYAALVPQDASDGWSWTERSTRSRPLTSPTSTAAIGFETALTAYLTYCVDQGDCPLGDRRQYRPLEAGGLSQAARCEAAANRETDVS